MYADDYLVCKPCDTKCKTCDKYSPSVCTSCDIKSIYPFLDGTTCIDFC